MPVSSNEDHAAAMGAWQRLNASQQLHAIAFIASQQAALVVTAARSAEDQFYPGHVWSLGQANTAIAHLSNRECRDVLSYLAVRQPAAVLAAIPEAGF